MIETTQNNLTQALSHLTLKDALIAALMTVILVVITRFIEQLVYFIITKYPDKRMNVLELLPFINVVFYFAGFLVIILTIFQPTKEYFLGFLASALLAIGFAARDLIQSVIAGIVLLFDKPFQVGDRITFNDHSGEIIHIGLRSIKLLTVDESIVTIANHRFMSDIVTSKSAGNVGMMTLVSIYMMPHTDIPKAVAVLKETAAKMPEIDKKHYPVKVFIEETFLGNTILLKLETRCAIKDARMEKEFQSAFIMHANKALIENKLR